MMATTSASNGKAHTTTPRWTRPVLAPTTSWLLAVERPFALVPAVLQSLARDNIALASGSAPNGSLSQWAQDLAHEIEHGHAVGVIVLTTDPGLVCCVANKVDPVRAVAILTLAQAAQATLSLQPNFVALEMPGRTYFEIRQVLRTFALTQPATDPIVKRGCACASAK